MLKAPRGLDTHCVAALGGGWAVVSSLRPHNSLPEMALGGSPAVQARRPQGKDSMFGIRSCAQTTIQGKREEIRWLTTVMLTEDASRWTLSPSSFSPEPALIKIRPVL